MKRFAELLDSLLFTPARGGKLRLLMDYFATVPDPDRGWGLAALTDGISLAAIKPAQRLGGGRQTQEGEWDDGRNGQRRERQEPRGAGKRRQEEPQTQPGNGQKEAADHREPRQRRPQPFPEDAPARTAYSEPELRARGSISRPGRGGTMVRQSLRQ